MKKIYILALFILCFGFCSRAYAMQTVFNVPSADVAEDKHIFLQQEAQFRPYNNGAFVTGTTYSSYGIGHHTEVDVNLFNVSAPSSNNITLGTGFKSAIPIPKLRDKYPNREYKFTVGSNVLTSLEGNGVGSWTYTHLSGRVPVTNTRLTAGVSYGTKQIFGTDNTAFIGAIEQPVTKKVSLLTDWFSGNEHFAGFMISGFSYSFKNNKTLYAGYQIPNSSKAGRSGFVIQLAKIF